MKDIILLTLWTLYIFGWGMSFGWRLHKDSSRTTTRQEQ